MEQLKEIHQTNRKNEKFPSFITARFQAIPTGSVGAA